MICPLKFAVYANPSPEDKVYQCHKDRCAWWHPNAGTPPEVGAGSCQVARIADRLADIWEDMPTDPSTLLK
jgi:hypothetical protein